MSESGPVSERLKDLIDDYLASRLDGDGISRLEKQLSASAEARQYFVRYTRLHTDLHVEMRARAAGTNALNCIERLAKAGPDEGVPATGRPAKARFLGLFLRRWAGAVAALVLIVLGVLWAIRAKQTPPDGMASPAVAWLRNAQNCSWSNDVEPAGDMGPGTVLQIESGLAEIRFRCGARVVLQGPARLELLSAKSAKLVRGKLTAQAAFGFEILSPQGKVIDLGTEFGVAVSEKGSTDVYVFDGEVEAFSSHSADRQGNAVSVKKFESARIADGKVVKGVGAGKFVRAIVPPPVFRPRTFRLRFDREMEFGIRDTAGRVTGLTHRLPNTGDRLAHHDRNLRLDPSRGLLELTTTRTDINNQSNLAEGEYLGIRLADLGFTGVEDFEARLTVPNVPALENYGQFGLYAGTDSALNIRGGIINSKWKEPGRNTQFLVNNNGGGDSDVSRIGLLSPGADLRLTLRRAAGKYSLTVENLTDGSSSTLEIRHPGFLEERPDLFVGLFGANAQSNVPKRLMIREFQVTVWTVATPVAAAAP
jgi:hypothetical protein